MARTRTSAEDHEVNEFIGRRLASFRLERGWRLEDLASRVGVSAGHLKSLESGRYSFNAGLLLRLAAALGRPVEAMLPGGAGSGAEGLLDDWRRQFDALGARDRLAVLDLARRLAGSDPASIMHCWKRIAAGRGLLVSLEGVDGVLLHEQGEALARRVRARAPGFPALHCVYDFDSGLWQFMLRRFAEMEESPHRAFERTLLYACERLQRQETRIRPALREGGLIVTHYFSLAPVVFQQMEGLMDTTVARAIANVLLEPDVVVFFKCDPRMAAGRAVSCRPGKGQFFSPYSGVDRFRKAQELYEAQMEEVRASGVTVHVLDGRKASTRLSEAVFRAVSPLLPSASAAGARRVGPAGRQ